jgi:transposase
MGVAPNQQPLGRPAKLTPELQNKICDAIRAGNYLETAAAFAGIGKSTFYDWLRRGQRVSKGIYHDFSAAVEKALADAEARDVALIAKAAADGHWQAAAWRLERRFSERWGRRETVHATVKGKLAHTQLDLGRIDLSRITNEELNALEQIYSKILLEPGATSKGGAASCAGGEGQEEP